MRCTFEADGCSYCTRQILADKMEPLVEKIKYNKMGHLPMECHLEITETKEEL